MLLEPVRCGVRSLIMFWVNFPWGEMCLQRSLSTSSWCKEDGLWRTCQMLLDFSSRAYSDVLPVVACT